MRTPAGTREIEALIDEVVALFHRLRAASSELHGHGRPIPGQRGVLFDLARRGSQTVAAMARVRGVSRQNIQTLVNRLRARGLLALRDNPAHRRSRLVDLTPPGRRQVRTMAGREAVELSALASRLSPARIRRASAVLRALSQDLCDRPARRRPPGSR